MTVTNCRKVSFAQFANSLPAFLKKFDSKWRCALAVARVDTAPAPVADAYDIVVEKENL